MTNQRTAAENLRRKNAPFRETKRPIPRISARTSCPGLQFWYDWNAVKEFLFPVLVQNEGVQFTIKRIPITTKGFFPYEWMDFLEKLEHPSLPPHEAFFSTLKHKNISDEDYQCYQQVWSKNNMHTFREFLIWYNNLDVQPFFDALEKMCAFGEIKRSTC